MVRGLWTGMYLSRVYNDMRSLNIISTMFVKIIVLSLSTDHGYLLIWVFRVYLDVISKLAEEISRNNTARKVIHLQAHQLT